MWLPSVIFVYGRAGTTPATEMGAFGIAPFLLSLLVVVALRLWRPPAVALSGVAVMAGARVALQATAGGEAQLWLATVALLGGLTWLAAVAAGAVGAGAAGLGLVAGMAGDAALHAVLRSTGPAWRAGTGWWVTVVVLAAGAVLLAWQAGLDERGSPGGAREWLAVGPVLFVHALIAGVVSRVHAVTGWTEPAAVAVVVGGWALALLVVWTPVGPARARHVGAVAALAGVLAALAAPSWLVAAGHVLLPVGLALVTVGVLGAPGDRSPPARATAASFGLVVFGVLVFVYYAAYDWPLGFPNAAVPVVAVLLAGGIALSGRSSAPVRVRPPAWAGAPVALGLVLAVAGVAAAASPPGTEAGDGLPVRVMLYNLQMGFDVHGRQSVDAQAQVIAEQRPDIVVLNEVSRGWLVNAATDTLPRIAERVGLPAHFAPAADRVWGNALLSRFPPLEVRSGLLPQGPVAMRRGYVAAVLDLGGGAELGVLGTHLTHVAEGADVREAQVRVLLEEARRLAEGGRPVVLVGDLDAQPGDRELAPLLELLTDVSEPWHPVATHPSWEPARHIDHIFVSPDLAARDYTVPQTTASDHLPVAVTLTRAPGHAAP